MFGKKEISKLVPVKVTDKRGRVMTVWKRPDTGETFGSVKQFLEKAKLPGDFKYDSKQSIPGHKYVFQKISKVETEGSKEVSEGFRVWIDSAKKLGKDSWVTHVDEFRKEKDIKGDKIPVVFYEKITGPWGKQTSLQDAVNEVWDAMEKLSRVK